MASIIPSFLTIANVTTVSSACPFSHGYRNVLQRPVVSKRKCLPSTHKVSCKPGDRDDGEGASRSPNEEPSSGKIERRDVLIGLGGLYGSASLRADPLALAEPVVPDFTKCYPPNLPPGAKHVNCCPPERPTQEDIVDFNPPPMPPTLRVRQAAHLVDNKYIAKYTKAVELMKALPNDDPRNFYQQANVHCAYCNGAYHQVGFPDLEVQIHHGWLFFPWHRCYLYFYEKILGKLIDDPYFTLPFWNYDAPEGMYIPAIYSNQYSTLYDKLRDPLHQPPTVIALNYDKEPTDTPLQRIATNLKIMKSQVVGATKPSLFFGYPYRAGDKNERIPDKFGCTHAGSVEHVPHNTVHDWTGDRCQPNREDMGVLYSASRDPIFFAHHANIDRLWTIWKGQLGRKDINDPDWLDAEFFFYNENKQLVRIKVRDCVDEKKLGYTYQEVDIPWISSKPTPRNGTVKRAREDSSDVEFPRVLNSVVKIVVQRPKKSRSKEEKEDEEEVLVIYGIELQGDEFVKFDVFINEDDVTESGPAFTEFAGSFVNLPHYPAGMSMMKKVKTAFKIGITSLLEELGADDDAKVLVTLVPRQGTDVVIGGLRIEFVS